MAEQSLSADRRAFLGGGGALAVAAVAAASVPTLAIATAPRSRTAWNAALANVGRAEAALEASHPAFNRTEALYWSLRPKPPTVEELLAVSGEPIQAGKSIFAHGAAVKADYERRDDLVRQQTGHAEAAFAQTVACQMVTLAVEALILVPAPDLAAVVLKIELAKTECMDLHDLDPVVADLHRLERA